MIEGDNMNPEKVGKFIQKIRKENHLTQQDLADKYGVTYQAVSKWERGINLPEISLLKQISKDFNVSIDDILEGELSTKKITHKKRTLIILSIIILLLVIALIIQIKHHTSHSFNFKTISATCDEFEVSGSIAYDKNKSSIYISNINYCGGDDNSVYDSISCELFEEEGKSKTLISKCNVDGKEEKLEDFLKKVEIKVDNYEQQCKSYTHNKIYLEIKAGKDKKTTVYKVDLDLNNNTCNEEEKK